MTDPDPDPDPAAELAGLIAGVDAQRSEVAWLRRDGARRIQPRG